MEDYYEHDDTLDKALQELTSYVSWFLNLGKRYADIINEPPYYYDYIEDRLSKYDDTIVISRLKQLLDNLSSITLSDIKRAISDEEGWEDNEIISKEEVRLKILEEKKSTQDFIQGIINRRKKISQLSRKRGFDIKDKNSQIKAMKAILIEGGFIDDNSHFVKILRGEASNEKINWKTRKNHFVYFVKKLFKKFFDSDVDWRIIEDSFTIHGYSK
ncbi:MAG: hypothetical protein LBV43_09120 [Prevotella sp.]|jgi:hypothetical protein|nr:hypothetical protein [Prevotella sp.]